MKGAKTEKLKAIISAFLIVLALDIITKQIVRAKLQAGSIALMPGFTLSSTTNTGALFGMLQGANQFLIWISLIVLGALLYFHEDLTKKPGSAIFFGLILGGLAGNLIDRVIYGGGLDFIGL